jgi:hypothetical protein
LARQKLEITKKLSGNGVYDASDFTITIGDEIIDLKEKLQMFNGEDVRFSFALLDVISEGKSE